MPTGDDARGIQEPILALDRRQADWATIRRPMLHGRYTPHSLPLHRRPDFQVLKASIMLRHLLHYPDANRVRCRWMLPPVRSHIMRQWIIHLTEVITNVRVSHGKSIA